MKMRPLLSLEESYKSPADMLPILHARNGTQSLTNNDVAGARKVFRQKRGYERHDYRDINHKKVIHDFPKAPVYDKSA